MNQESTDITEQVNIDPRLKQLSYSSLLTLHACPRKFQLNRLNAEAQDTDSDGTQSLTYTYGSTVGLGIQLVLQGYSEQEILWKLFLEWKVDLLAINEKQKKSYWLAVAAVQRFNIIRNSSLLADYELLEYNGTPATELSFAVSFPGGFRYRGFIDAVLRHKTTGKILVLECKTSSANTLNRAEYKNSSQGVGYSCILDIVAPAVSSYDLLYLIYKTKTMEYEVFLFNKSYLQRALWIQELLLDIDYIKMCDSTGVFPMRGENCYSYYRECEYFHTCTLSTNYLTKPVTAEILQEIAEEKFQIEVTLNDLIAAQLSKDIMATVATVADSTGSTGSHTDNLQHVVFAGDEVL